MKLLRYGSPHQEQPGIVDAAGNIRSLSGIIDDVAGEALSPASLDRLRGLDLQTLPLAARSGERGAGNEKSGRSGVGDSSLDPRSSSLRLGPCVGRIGKVMCIGLNYSEHAAETGAAIPTEPILFMKATSAIVGPMDDIRIPRTSTQTDWEAELGVVIGSPAKYVSEEQALDYVAGYCVSHDVSERSFQKDRGGQWTKGKSCDTFGPLGPWLVTKDEIPDPQNLAVWLEVDGQRRQNGSTRTMIFGVKKLVSYLSQFFTLFPGDVISTGTPAGVGMGMKPPTYLRPGQTVRLSVEGLGVQEQRVVADE
jgi:2-keto-4-pentenoate hydratase/2-oxohepta-3-ene-1,7-dioic acid hydratase in catechol pathway